MFGRPLFCGITARRDELCVCVCMCICVYIRVCVPMCIHVVCLCVAPLAWGCGHLLLFSSFKTNCSLFGCFSPFT